MERIDSSPDQIISAAIMAGFLPLAETGAEREEINQQLERMWGDGVQIQHTLQSYNVVHQVCRYTLTFPDGAESSILWRCSARSVLDDVRTKSPMMGSTIYMTCNLLEQAS